MIMAQRGINYFRQRRDGSAARDRIGCVDRDQKRGLVAAPHRAFEFRRNFHREQHLAGCQRVIEVGIVAQNFDDAEKLGVLDRGQDRSSDVTRFLKQHGGWQLARGRIDGIAEQNQLQQRNRNHGRKGDAIAPQLQKFLAQHSAGATPKAARAYERQRQHGGHTHGKLSLAPAIRSMKTSSSDGAPRCQSRPGRSRKGATACSSAALSCPETCRLVPNAVTMLMPGRSLSSSASDETCSPCVAVTVNVVRGELLITSWTVPRVSTSPKAM